MTKVYYQQVEQVAVVVPTTALIVFMLFIVLTIRDHRLVLWDEFRRLLLPTLVRAS